MNYGCHTVTLSHCHTVTLTDRTSLFAKARRYEGQTNKSFVAFVIFVSAQKIDDYAAASMVTR
jgi:hypothetical protein